MLQSRVISEASFTFISIREFMSSVILLLNFISGTYARNDKGPDNDKDQVSCIYLEVFPFTTMTSRMRQHWSETEILCLISVWQEPFSLFRLFRCASA